MTSSQKIDRNLLSLQLHNSMACLSCNDQLRKQRRISKFITRQLKEEKKIRDEENKHKLVVLLLGTSGSGKTTLMKQNRIISGQGYTEEDRMEYISTIHTSVLIAVQCLVNGMSHLSIQYENPANEKASKQLADILPYTMISIEHYGLISQLWKDAGVHDNCYSRRREFKNQLIDSAKYLLDNLDRICDHDYVPTVEDMLRVSVPTTKGTNIEEFSFTQDGVRTINMVTMAGQSAERPTKWASCFCGVATIVYLVDVSEYDKVVRSPIDGKNTNCLEQSRKLFKQFLDYQLLTHTRGKLNIILLFNKYDIFEEKINYSHLTDYFPAYKGPRQDSQSAIRFIHGMFPTGLIGDSFVHCETLCAVDSSNTTNDISEMIKSASNQETLTRMAYI